MKLRRLVPAIVAATALAIAGCSGGGGGGGGSASPTGEPQKGGTLTFLLPTAPLDLDPSTSQDNNVAMPMWNSWFEELVVFDGNEYAPWLAKSWTESDDALTYTFTLDERAKFSDGSPMTSEDVLFSLQRNADPDVSLLNFLKAKIDSITAPTPQTFEIKLKEPWPHLLADLASPNGAIYSKAAFEKVGDPKKFFNTSPTGTGPFTLGNVTANSAYEVDRNTNYWNPDAAPYLDKIAFQVVTDETARVTAVVGGRADLAQSPPPNQLEALKSNSAVQVFAFPAARVELFALNTKKAPFDNPALREAFSLAMDRASIVKTGLFGFGEAASTFLVAPPSQTYQNTSLNLYSFDLDKAKQLVDSSGVPTPITVPLTVSTGTDQDAILAIAQAGLEKVGFKVVPDRKDAASVDNDIIGQSFTAATTFWGNVSGDPAIQSLFANVPDYCCDAYFTGLNDATLIEQTNAAIAESDAAKAQAAWDDVQRSVAKANHIVPLYFPQLTYLGSSSVQNFQTTPAGFYNWASVWKSSSTG